MNKMIGAIALFISMSAFAFHPPTNITLSRGGEAIFVDFTSAVYNINYDVRKRAASASSTIEFTSNADGYPIFDLVPEIDSITLDGEVVSVQKLLLENNVSSVLYIDKIISAGTHKLVITNKITKNLTFGLLTRSISSAFWMSDLTDKKYLEQYLPTNLEYDQYEYTFMINVIGDSTQYEVMTNGALKNMGDNTFEINFPKYFTTSSPFFHLTEINRFKKVTGSFLSVDGRQVPILIYGKKMLDSYMKRALSTLKDLEKDYGKWPHPSVVIYGAGSGGMEYCGATISSISALGHELTHSYFARGVMPARGNAGWIDEAMASWRDNGYRQVNLERLSKTKMAGHSIYRRTTDRAAYTKGRDFLGYLDKKFSDLGGLKPFMRKLYQERVFKPILTRNFMNYLTVYFGEDLAPLFDEYIYGKNGITKFSIVQENPMHQKLSEKELQALL